MPPAGAAYISIRSRTAHPGHAISGHCEAPHSMSLRAEKRAGTTTKTERKWRNHENQYPDENGDSRISERLVECEQEVER